MDRSGVLVGLIMMSLSGAFVGTIIGSLITYLVMR